MRCGGGLGDWKKKRVCKKSIQWECSFILLSLGGKKKNKETMILLYNCTMELC